jgi:hypothetical protein
MATSNDLFLAILALDSYNRGYAPQLVLTKSGDALSDAAGTKIGNAKIVKSDGEQPARCRNEEESRLEGNPMTTHTLMLALLSLDAYNRGSFSELKWSNAGDGKTPGKDAPTKIGGATLIATRDRETVKPGEKVKTLDLDIAGASTRNGFYAAAYEVDGKKVTAIRPYFTFFTA